MLSSGLENRATSVSFDPWVPPPPPPVPPPLVNYSHLPLSRTSLATLVHRHAFHPPLNVLIPSPISVPVPCCSCHIFRPVPFSAPVLRSSLNHPPTVSGESLGRASKLFHSSIFPFCVSVASSFPLFPVPCVENSRCLSLYFFSPLLPCHMLCKYSPSLYPVISRFAVGLPSCISLPFLLSPVHCPYRSVDPFLFLNSRLVTRTSSSNSSFLSIFYPCRRRLLMIT